MYYRRGLFLSLPFSFPLSPFLSGRSNSCEILFFYPLRYVALFLALFLPYENPSREHLYISSHANHASKIARAEVKGERNQQHRGNYTGKASTLLSTAQPFSGEKAEFKISITHKLSRHAVHLIFLLRRSSTAPLGASRIN